MANLQKKEIVQAIQEEKKRLGSYSSVATKVGVSEATISQIINNNWENIAEAMWQKVANQLGMNARRWNIAETLAFHQITKYIRASKERSLFIALSCKAGSGKTATLKTFAEQNKGQSVFFIQAREWSKRDFLLELCRTLGVDTGKGYTSVDKLGMKAINFLSKRKGKNPLLIVDEADKLKASALRWFITLYNELEDEIGVIIAGTENLEKTIKRGVKYSKLGFDEIDSRFGRKFINDIVGARFVDVEMICRANGLTDKSLIKSIFKELNPKEVTTAGGIAEFIDDLRRLKRIIQRELLTMEIR
ncbi:AAA family ATPase [Riemerella anatipestifer]|nr:AAA family ATPase [Riemerella anatipestifer]